MLTLLPASCATMTDSGVTETQAALCDQFKPTAWSLRDTDETIAQIKGNNAVGARICGWRAK